jgi:hypothetical protein
VEVAGSVVVDIGGNLTPLETAFAKGEQMTLAFNAKVNSILAGSGLTSGLEKIAAGVDQTNALLAKLTTSGTTAGASMTKLVTATQPVTAALNQVTTATAATNAELGKIGTSAGAASFGAGTISAKDFAAALEATGGNLSKITPQMLGMAAAEDALAASTEAAAVSFRGLTEAQVAAFAAQQEGANFNRALNESFGLINSSTKSARDSASVFREMAVAEDAAAAASRGAAGGMEAVGIASSHAAGLGAGVTREFSVLGAEVARGNFSRIPGSLIVLNERLVSTGTSVLTLSNFMKAFGGLASVIFNPYVIGFLGLTIGLDLAIKGFNELKGGALDLNTVLENHKKLIDEIAAAYPTAANAAKAYEEQASKLPKEVAGADTFKQIEDEQKLLKSLTFDLSNSLTVLGNDYAAFGSAGSAAFVKLGEDLKSGAVTASDVQKTLGDLRIDPSLNKNAHDFATWLQESATQAANLELHLRGAAAAGNVFKGSTVGRGDEGDNILANMISAGNAAAEALKKVEDSTRTSGLTSYARAVANINREFDDAIVKAHASGAALDTFNQARNLSIQEEAVKSLNSVNFDAPIGGAKEFAQELGTVGNAASGVKVELGGMAAPIVNITQLFQRAKLDQLIGIEQAGQRLRGFNAELDDTKHRLEVLQNYPVDKLFGAGSAGSAADISGAYNAIDELFKRFDDGSISVKDLYDGIEQVRASLVALGGNVASVNEFVNGIVNGEARVRQLNGDVQNLSQSIRNIPNKTVTITIKTQRIGSGTQSLYDVPGGTVGVTRYGSDGSSSGPSITANQVSSYMGGGEASGYGSSYGVSGGTNTVNVTRYSSTGPWENPNGATANEWSQLSAADKEAIYEGKTDYAHILYPDYYKSAGSFATGGMIHPGDTQQVSFFKSPDETVGIFTPGQMQALADPQSGFNGQQPTANDNRAWTVLMNVEANTKKTAQLLDEIKTATASASSALGGSSYGGGSSGVDTSQQAQLSAQYAQVLKQIRSNFAAAGIVGRGIIGYGLDGLASSPEEIARNIVYGGAKPTGFATGGMIAPGDSQEVRFFKSPEETVAIFTPQQVQALQGANQNGQATATDQRPITFQMPITVQGGGQVSNDSIAEMKRQFALALREGLRSINGR